MKTMILIRTIFLMGLVATAILPIRAEDNEAVKKDMARLQGEWQMVSGSADGRQMPDEMRKQMKRVCQGDVTTTTMAGRIFFKATFVIDPSNKPKTIDYQMTEGPTKDQKQLGIYEISGDTFKACFGKPGAGRPADFTSNPGDGRTVSVWKREKQAAPAPEKEGEGNPGTKKPDDAA